MSVNGDATGLESFQHYVDSLKPTLKRQYDRNINRDLSQHNSQGLLKRNISAVLKQAYEASLTELQQLSFGPEFEMNETVSHNLTLKALKPFVGFIDELLEYALQQHRSSCALSNFPDEHRPSQDYIAQVLQLTHQDWQAFVLDVNHMFKQYALTA